MKEKLNYRNIQKYWQENYHKKKEDGKETVIRLSQLGLHKNFVLAFIL
jgi:hypothetical protein